MQGEHSEQYENILIIHELPVNNICIDWNYKDIFQENQSLYLSENPREQPFNVLAIFFPTFFCFHDNFTFLFLFCK